MAKKNETVLKYKTRPLIRNGNTIYYGDMADPYIVVMQVTGTEPFQDLEVPNRISIQLLSTNESLPLLERIEQNTEKQNFYDAINIASIWLDRMLKDSK